MSTQAAAVTVSLDSETEFRLERLAQRTKRTKSFLAGKAIADYVERELAIVEAIERGLSDVEAGRVTPHDEAMRRLRDTVKRAAGT